MKYSKEQIYSALETTVLFCDRRFIDPHDRAATIGYMRDLCRRLDESPPEDLKTILEDEYRSLCLKKELSELGKGEVREGKKMQALSAFADELKIKLSEPDFASIEALRGARHEARQLRLRITVSDEQVRESLQDIVQQVTQKEPNHALFMALSLLLQNSVNTPVVDIGSLVTALPGHIHENLAKEYSDFCQRLYKDETKREEAIASLDDAKIESISRQIIDQLKADYHIISREELQSMAEKAADRTVEDIANISFQGSREGYTRKLYLEPEQRDAFNRSCRRFADKFEDGMNLATYVAEGDYSNLFPHSMKGCLSIFMRRVLLEAGYDAENIKPILEQAPVNDIYRK